MIDLHMHTKYSDGTDSVVELLSKAKESNIEIISITDHDTCRAYEELELYEISLFYKGKIIVGCEFTTSFNNRLIEVLGYGFDYKKVNEYLNNFFSKDNNIKNHNIIFDRLRNKIKELNLIIDFNIFNKKNLIFKNIYNELIKNQQNYKIIKEDIWDSFSDFFRKGLTNPNSKIFINHAEFKPKLKDIIDLIHNNGGKVFLAHPFQYKLENTELFINKLFDEYNLDGIECFYTTFSKGQTEYLINFAKKRNLLISGGSDYHGLNKKRHELGIGNGTLNINKEIINNWNIKYCEK